MGVYYTILFTTFSLYFFYILFIFQMFDDQKIFTCMRKKMEEELGSPKKPLLWVTGSVVQIYFEFYF